MASTDEYVQATSGFVAAQKEGRPRTVKGGQVLPADDPIVKSHRDLFRPVSEVVEQATRAPGELRATPTRHPCPAPDCNDRFATTQLVAEHVADAHANDDGGDQDDTDNAADSDADEPSDDSETLECDVCDFTTTKGPRSLAAHSRVHDSEDS